MKYSPMKDVIFEIVITVVIVVAAVFSIGSLYEYVIGKDPASEYRALCIKNEGKPVFNGKYWECIK